MSDCENCENYKPKYYNRGLKVAKKLYESLDDYCNRFLSCETCPFYVDGGSCMVIDARRKLADRYGHDKLVE